MFGLASLLAAWLLAACGSATSGDQAAELSKGEPTQDVAPIENDEPALAAGEVAAAAEFYGRNVVSIIVGSGPGGGFDTTARLVARHIGRYIPGTPTVIVVNMAGGGGLVAANYVFSAAPRDGTVIGLFHEAQVMNQLSGVAGVGFDLRKFNWLGSSYDDPNVCVVRSDAPVKTFQDLIGRDEPVVIGGTAPGSASYDAPRVVAEATGANFKTVSGYSTTNDVRLGIERGEVQGVCLGWESVRTGFTQWLDDGYVRLLVQNGAGRQRDLPNVPLALDFARDEESLGLLRLLAVPSAMAKPFAMPPDVREERVRVMRHALLAVYHDSDFQAEAARMRLDFQPKTAAEIRQVLNEVLATSPELAARYRQIVQP